jgi:hypothetical protein
MYALVFLRSPVNSWALAPRDDFAGYDATVAVPFVAPLVHNQGTLQINALL